MLSAVLKMKEVAICVVQNNKMKLQANNKIWIHVQQKKCKWNSWPYESQQKSERILEQRNREPKHKTGNKISIILIYTLE